MILKAKKSSILSLGLEGKSEKISQDGPPYSIRTRIKIPLHSPLFRDLFLSLYYTAQTVRGPLSNIHGELSDIGWGVSGLLPANTRINLSSYGTRISFDIECSIQLKIGSLEKDGLSLPMPFPIHRGLISGWYDYLYHDYFARFHEFGNDF
jgi:hypothetical protein